ncbi:MAG: cytochrome [Pseudomonas sp.]|jgi:mono/diheme cytochrome c family protein|uniref:c-type cytochrome n=1 Tax=Pseudomonas sp. TaxID=306 RepID=UPI0026037CB9|nr:cytochrome c [Pseudomonas sp.]MDB6050922.1 cytochrome [Pseudomonas sp.]
MNWKTCLLRQMVIFAIGSVSLQVSAASSELIQRGKYVSTVGDCVACHSVPGGQPFAGGLDLSTPIGTIISTNITPSKTAGIGNYTLEQFSDALRKGIRADGAHLYPAMPYTSYAKVSDDDVQAMYAYFMNSVAAVDTPTKATELPFPFSIRLSMAGWNLLFLDSHPYTADPAHSAEWNRGAYLTQGLTHCSACHSPRNLLMAEVSSEDLAGGDVGTWYAPNITADPNAGIGGWETDELVKYLKTGSSLGKGQAAGPMAEAVDHSLQYLTSADAQAIAVYLKSVPAHRDPADSKPVYALGQKTDELGSVRGIALPADPNKMSGAQIYDGYCASCHQAQGQGSFEGGLPSLSHNTAVGRSNTHNLVMVILEGIHRNSDGSDLRMPGFARTLTDPQIATLVSYLTRLYGNPEANVSVAQVQQRRGGGAESSLIAWVQGAMVGGVMIVLTLMVWFVRRRRRM